MILTLVLFSALTLSPHTVLHFFKQKAKDGETSGTSNTRAVISEAFSSQRNLSYNLEETISDGPLICWKTAILGIHFPHHFVLRTIP